jgi:predicted CXXCH cytochrome family protein
MAITVRFIRRRAGGRITIRPTTFDGREIVIGRATDCDVFLPDLRVSLHHARFTQVGPRRALIEALGERRIKVGGAVVSRREVSLEDGEKILIGPYQMTVEPGANDGDVLLSIELVQPSAAPVDQHEEEEIFSLKAVAPDKRAGAWLLGLLVLGVLLAYPVFSFFTGMSGAAQGGRGGGYAADRPWLSGKMSSAHANLVNECATCHEKAFVRVGDDVCLSCHEGTLNHTHAEMLAAAAPHAEGASAWLVKVRASLDIPEGRCGSCHFEHNGPEGVTPSDQRLCTECHDDLTSRLANVSLLDVGDFSTHPEFRPTVVVEAGKDAPKVERISLAAAPRESSGLIFPHDFHLTDPEVLRKLATLAPAEQRGFGEDMDCAGCHQIDAGGALFAPIEMERNCAMCHSLVFAVSDAGERRVLPHGEPEDVARVLEDFYYAQASQLALADPEIGVLDRQLTSEARARRERLREQAFGKAREETERMVARVFSDGGICQKCHTVTPPAAGQARTDYHVADVSLLDRFMPKAHFVHAAHMTGNIECATCHASETSSSSTDLLMPAVATCRECHGKSDGKGGIASDCLTCHVYHGGADAPPMTAAKPTKALK